ncbi:MAG: hypothetical protein KME17_00355 [Cyanosarcina radialis HA8281-LM2]|jgi:hypothetical protein|nr:hypothetical protein [Cyanosarcina radialis HA8281-LM2]
MSQAVCAIVGFGTKGRGSILFTGGGLALNPWFDPDAIAQSYLVLHKQFAEASETEIIYK